MQLSSLRADARDEVDDASQIRALHLCHNKQIPAEIALFVTAWHSGGIAKRVAQISSGNLSTADWGKERYCQSSVKCGRG